MKSTEYITKMNMSCPVCGGSVIGLKTDRYYIKCEDKNCLNICFKMKDIEKTNESSGLITIEKELDEICQAEIYRQEKNIEGLWNVRLLFYLNQKEVRLHKQKQSERPMFGLSGTCIGSGFEEEEKSIETVLGYILEYKTIDEFLKQFLSFVPTFLLKLE